MILKSVKIAALSVAGLGIAGGALFGTELGSYVTSGVRSVRTVAKDNVPMEFELQRARDLLDDIIPEMQANIRLIAQQEVEIAALREDIQQSQRGIAEEQNKVAKLRDCLGTSQVGFTFNGLNYDRSQLKEELARRFDRFKEAEMILTGKRRLLDNREKALHAGVQIVERTRSQKALLEGKIEALDGQMRLVQAASVGSQFSVDPTKIAQTEKLIAQVKKQLDVAERVLSHEARFTESIPVDGINETDLVAQVDEHFSAREPEQAVSRAESR